MYSTIKNSWNYETVICVNCGRPFMRKSSASQGTSRRLPNGVKPRGTINCTPKCTKEWRNSGPHGRNR